MQIKKCVLKPPDLVQVLEIITWSWCPQYPSSKVPDKGIGEDHTQRDECQQHHQMYNSSVKTPVTTRCYPKARIGGHSLYYLPTFNNQTPTKMHITPTKFVAMKDSRITVQLNMATNMYPRANIG